MSSACRRRGRRASREDDRRGDGRRRRRRENSSNDAGDRPSRAPISSTSWPSCSQQRGGLACRPRGDRVDLDRRQRRCERRSRCAAGRARAAAAAARTARPAAAPTSRRPAPGRRARRAAARSRRPCGVSTPSAGRGRSRRATGASETRPRARLEADEPAARGGDADRAAAVVAVRDRDHARRRPRPPRRRTSRRACARGPTGCASGRCGATRWSAGSRTPAALVLPTITKPAARRRRDEGGVVGRREVAEQVGAERHAACPATGWLSLIAIGTPANGRGSPAADRVGGRERAVGVDVRRTR